MKCDRKEGQTVVENNVNNTEIMTTWSHTTVAK